MFILLVVQSYISYTEINNLVDRISLVKYYGLRQKMIATLTSMAKTYYTTLQTDKNTFNSYITKVLGRISLLSTYNENTIKALISQDLNYDFELVTVPDLPSGSWNIWFSHAILIVCYQVKYFISSLTHLQVWQIMGITIKSLYAIPVH